MTKKPGNLWGLKQNKKAPKQWYENERLWTGVYKVAEVQEVKIMSGITKSLCLVREERLETLNPRK